VQIPSRYRKGGPSTVTDLLGPLSKRKKKRKEKKNYAGIETTPYVDQGKGDTLAQRAVSLLHQENEELLVLH